MSSILEKTLLLIIVAVAMALSACGKTESQKETTHANTDAELKQIIQQHELTGNPSSNQKIPNIDSAKAQLGMKLFYSKTLGGDNTTACATCHHPMLGGGDNLSLSVGTNSSNPNILGGHRKIKMDGQPQVPRNAPTTFNVAFYKKMMFYDGRIERLDKYRIHTPDVSYPQEDPLAGDNLVQAQARFPITSVDEMRSTYMSASHNQTMRRALADRLKKNWLDAFRTGFSEPNANAEDIITEQNFSEAIGEYERSQVFINNPWKKYIEGDLTALSDSAKKGALLFYKSHQQGGADCARCHSGDFFTDEKAYNTGMPQIGTGKDSGATKSNDYGCNLVTGKPTDKFRFRTPSLLNTEVTGPWGHDGAFTSLEGITQHMLSPMESAKNYNHLQLKQDNISVKDLEINTQEALDVGLHLLPKPNLKQDDVKHITNFLKALTDPCVKDRTCLSKWIPKASDNDPDGQMLHAINGEDGKFL